MPTPDTKDSRAIDQFLATPLEEFDDSPATGKILVPELDYIIIVPMSFPVMLTYEVSNTCETTKREDETNRKEGQNQICPSLRPPKAKHQPKSK